LIQKLARLAIGFIEAAGDLLPGGALKIVDLAQIENVPLHPAAVEAAALDNRLGAMFRGNFWRAGEWTALFSRSLERFHQCCSDALRPTGRAAF
jgi:hypothetical protein